MLQHLRANLLLLFLTLVLCCVLYPLTLWGIGQTIFRSQADGSLLTGADKQSIGSRLIAQPFRGDEWFQPRPSAVSYNAMASGGSNFAATNPKLRGRVAQQLGAIVRYLSPDGPGKGALVGEDIEQWFQRENDPGKADGRRDLSAEWASSNSALVAAWATSSELISNYVKEWAHEHSGVLTAWQSKNPDYHDPPKAEDLAPFFFDPAVADSFVKLHPGMWPCTVEETRDGKTTMFIEPANKGDDIRSIFFDMWLQDHPGAKLEPVPADMVMTSGSGLDPHITLTSAQYQLPRVAKIWGEKTGAPENTVRQEIDNLLRDQASAPLGGLAGVPLINVLELNLAMQARMQAIQHGNQGSR